jgi:CubicO group peptidase (beta-lactamase class C family)
MKAKGFGSTSLMFLSCLLFPLVAHGQSSAPRSPDGSWKISTPEAQGVDSRKLLEMFQDIKAKGGSGLHSVLIVKNGYLIAESYLAPYHKETLHNVKSATKSILSALVGIALEKKYLKSLDQKVADFYPEYVNDPRKKDITLRHLLTMTAGLAWSYDQETTSPVSPTDLESWKVVPMRDAPGEKFEYNTMLAHMMSAILTKASGESTKELADSVLFGPLGISDEKWSQDNKGIYIGGSELFLRPRDMAKFGLLYLNKGVWNGRQIVPGAWVEESTSPKLSIGPDRYYPTVMRYGYWWWIPDQSYQARGYNGQYIIVRPDLNIVVVVTGENQGAIFQYLDPYIFRAALSKVPLPPNPKAVHALNRLLGQLETPEAQAVGPMPQAAAKVSGKKFALEANKMGMQSFVLSFKDGRECAMKVTTGELTLDFPIGLDGNFRIANAGVSFGNNSEQSQIASKGSWVDDKTFVFKFHILGDVVTEVFSLKFTDDDVSLALDVGNGISSTRIAGKMEK